MNADPLRKAMLRQRIPNMDDLAEKAGVARATVYRAFQSETAVSLDVTIKLSDALGITPVEGADLIAAQRSVWRDREIKRMQQMQASESAA